MATSGDPNQLKGIKPWKIPENPVVAWPDEESTFDSLFNFPRANFLHYASCITSSYVISFTLTNIAYHILLKKKKWSLRSHRHLKPRRESRDQSAKTVNNTC
jgi:hypothetical protein